VILDYQKEDTFVFDLDKTVWDTFSVHGYSIWAKQMVPPYSLEQNRIIDDVYSYCVLRPGIRRYLDFLRSNGKKVGFLSSGFLMNTEYDKQPSVNILKMFGIYEFFNFEKILLYKTYSKKDYLCKFDNCVFFDDNDEIIQEVSTLGNVKIVDSKKILDWSKLI